MSECGRPDCYITNLHTHQVGTDGIIGQVCKHGSLQRQCLICELESQRDSLLKENADLTLTCKNRTEIMDGLVKELALYKRVAETTRTHGHTIRKWGSESCCDMCEALAALPKDSVCGIPIRTDESLKPGEWRIEPKEGGE